MLIIARQVGDEIVLPDLRIRIRLHKIRGQNAWIGLDVPKEHVVLRRELLQRWLEDEKKERAENGKPLIQGQGIKNPKIEDQTNDTVG
jgi:carbon storage regulator CsrA